VPTSRLAVLAERLGKIVAASSTWHRLIQQRGWRRPRHRQHPRPSRVGLRTTAPNRAWLVDVTVLKLLDGTKLYLHGVVDNFSRRILAWRLATRNGAAGTVAFLRDAILGASSPTPPMLVVDGGSENYNGAVDELIEDGVLRRVLAQTEISFSNSMVEAFWRALKHQWLFLNTLDTEAAVRRLVATYVEAHNSQVPHSAFQGQTPGEMYFGTGAAVAAELAVARAEAVRLRLEHNRATTCRTCARSDPAKLRSEPAA
jgi:transposase InsO family protein